MTDAAELGPIVGLGAIEQTIRNVLRVPQVLGVYLDDALRQTYGADTRVARPRDIVASTETRVKLNMPAVVVQVEGTGNTTRMADRTYAAEYVVGVHCINSGGREADCRRTSDVLAAACRAYLLQRLLGVHVGPAVVSRVQWDIDVLDSQPAGGKSMAYSDLIVQLRVTVSGVVSDAPGRIPGLPPNVPGDPGPAPPPGLPPVIVDLPIEVEGPQPS